MEKASESVKDFTEDIGDVLTAALYPIDGVKFVRGKYESHAAAKTEAPESVDE